MTYLQKSPWIVHYNASSCNGCDIEILAALTPVFDVERFGIINTGNPKHADILLVTGGTGFVGSRFAFAAATTSAMARIGSRTPVLECTHVTPSTRVSGLSARSTRAVISATVACAHQTGEKLTNSAAAATIASLDAFRCSLSINSEISRYKNPPHSA